MRIRNLLLSSLLLAPLALTACATQEAPPPLPNVYAVDPIHVQVANVEMMDLSQGTVQVPQGWVDITGKVQPSPAQWVQQWAKERLVPQGTDGMIRVVVHRAQLIKLADVEAKTGMDGWFHEPMSRMQLEWEVVFKLYEGPSLNSKAEVTVTVKEAMRYQASEDIGDVYMRLTAAAKQKLEAESKSLMQQYFGAAYGG